MLPCSPSSGGKGAESLSPSDVAEAPGGGGWLAVVCGVLLKPPETILQIGLPCFFSR